MMPISVRDNSEAIKMGYNRANDTVNRFNQGLMSAGKEFGDATIKSRLFFGEWDAEDKAFLNAMAKKINDGVPLTDEEQKRLDKKMDDRSFLQKTKDFFKSEEKPNKSMPNSISEELPDLYDDSSDAARDKENYFGRDTKIYGDPEADGTSDQYEATVRKNKEFPPLDEVNVLGNTPEEEQKAKNLLKAEDIQKKADAIDPRLPLRAAETAGINTGYVPYSEQDKIKDNQRFTDEQAYQEAVRKAEASSIDNLRKQGEFNANENVLAEAINKQGDLTPNEKVATVNSIAKIKGIAPVEAAAENMSQAQVNNLANKVRGITEGPLAGEARKALANVETRGFTVENILELAKVNALSNLNLPYDKANSTDVQAAIQSSIMQNADSNLIKQNSQQLIGSARMEAREFVNNFTVPEVHRSGQYAPKQETKEQPQINETIQTMNSKWNELNDEQRTQILEIMGMI
jgi:hypothetical protein